MWSARDVPAMMHRSVPCPAVRISPVESRLSCSPTSMRRSTAKRATGSFAESGRPVGGEPDQADLHWTYEHTFATVVAMRYEVDITIPRSLDEQTERFLESAGVRPTG